jgi:deoxyribose-phosphate aldolase
MDLPHMAAVCVYPSMVAVAREALRDAKDRAGERETGRAAPNGSPSRVKVASVATAFPSGQYPLAVRLRDTEEAVRAGADEIDMVINRGAFLAGRYDEVAREIKEVACVCNDGGSHLKVILETGELETYDNVRRASDLAIEALDEAGAQGAFIKTSTGKVQPAATMGVTLVMLEAIRDHAFAAGRCIGMKPAGGISTAKQAVQYLVMVQETMPTIKGEAMSQMANEHSAGQQTVEQATHLIRNQAQRGGRDAHPTEASEVCPWLTPTWFRFGASSLANDLLRQLSRMATGGYAASYEFPEA